MRHFQSTSTPKGFTLVEAMVSLGLFGLIITLTASLMVDHSSFLKMSSRLDKRTESQIALSQLTLELQQALDIVSPVPGNTASVTELEFTRVKPGQEWLSSSSWNPSNNTVTIKYRVDGRNNLVRELDDGGTVSSSVVAESVGLSGAWNSIEPSEIEVKITVSDGNRHLTLRTTVGMVISQ